MKKILALFFLFFLYYFSQAQTQIPSQLSLRKALDIDGQTNFIDAGTTNRNIGNAVTLEAWVRTNQTHNQWIAGKKNAVGGFSLEIRNGRAVFEGTGGPVTSSGLSLTV